MNERIRQRQKQKIQQIIERTMTATPEQYGELAPLWHASNEHKDILIPQRQEVTVQPPPAEPGISSVDSLPPADWTASSPTYSPPAPNLIADSRDNQRHPEYPYEQDPEKLWKSNAAPWLGMYSDRLHAPGNRNANGVYGSEGGGSKFWRHFRNQLILSAMLFGIIWGVFKLEGEPAQQAQTAVTTALTTEFDFQTVSAWYERTFAGSPAFIPLFGSSSGNAETVDGTALTAQAVVSPLPESTLVKSFAQSLGGIELAGRPGDPVSAAETGQVVLVTPNAGEGQTVIIQHAGGRQTQYGQLGEAKVRKDDWVEAGDVIGRLGSGTDGGHSLLYFAVKEEGRFIDPTDVIPLD